MSALRKQKGVALLVVLILLVMMSAPPPKSASSSAATCRKRIIRSASSSCAGRCRPGEKVVKDRLQSDASGESNALSPEGDWQQPLETQGKITRW